MSALPLALISSLAAASLGLAGCKDKSRLPSGPPSFEADLSLGPHGGAGLDEAQIATALQARADRLQIPLQIESGPPQDAKLTVSLYASTEPAARRELKQLCQSARLELRQVHPKSSSLAPLVARGESIVPGYAHVDYNYTDGDGAPQTEPLLLSKRSNLRGEHIKRAWPDPARAGVISVELTANGGKEMRKLTAPMKKGIDRLAIVLNNQVVSAPVVQDTLSTNFIIQGIHREEERTALCTTLMVPLGAELTVDAVRAHPPAAP